jgi:uncharacterized protein YkwD
MHEGREDVAHAPVAAQTPGELLATARAVIERANAVRADVDARVLNESPELMQAAQEYAEELARLERLSHESPTAGRITMQQRVAATGVSWQRAAENLAALSGRAEIAGNIIDMWLRSPGHRRNLLDPVFTLTGVGVARDRQSAWYVVQLYGLPARRR